MRIRESWALSLTSLLARYKQNPRPQTLADKGGNKGMFSDFQF
jgi:hypothetical protein